MMSRRLSIGAVLTVACLTSSASIAQTAAERIEAAKARVAALEQRSERIGDLNAIENLQRSFGYYLDKMLWDEVIDLFADDASVEIGTSGVYVGKESIRDYFYGISGGGEGPLEGELFEHMQLQPIVTVADDGMTALGRWRAWIMTGTSGAGSGGKWGEGPYENAYVKEDGIWKISRLHWFGNFLVPYEGGWLNADPDGLAEYSEGNGTSPDLPPSTDYAPYPAAFTPPFHFENPGRSN
jgi:hypothetical protein